MSAGTGALSLVSTTAALFKSQGIKGIQGFVFDVPLENTITLRSQITDHYVEENYAIQDHVAVEPIRIRAAGKVGELVYTQDELQMYISTVLAMLAPISGPGPNGTTKKYISPDIELKAQAALAQYNQTKQATLQAIKTAQNAAASVGIHNDLLGIDGNAPKDNQGKAFKQFFDWWFQRSQISTQTPGSGALAIAQNAVGINSLVPGSGWSLLTVETPWRSFPDMVLESVEFSQDETTLMESTVTVELKQLRVAPMAASIAPLSQGYAQAAAPVQNQGTAKTATVPQSVGAGVLDSLGAAIR